MRPILVALAVLGGAAAAAAADLQSFLTAASDAARPTTTVRGDGTLVTASPDGSTTDQIALLRSPNGGVYLESRTAGTRVLLLGDGRTAYIVPAAGARSRPLAPDENIGTSEFTAEDLRAFALGHYRSPTIVDRRDGEVTVSLTPEPSQYALQVITFDTEKKVPLLVKNYKETISNLVKMRRSRQLTETAGAWLPGEIAMENFPLRVTSTMTLRWQPAGDAAGLFDPASLEKPSTLAWPDAQGQQGQQGQ